MICKEAISQISQNSSTTLNFLSTAVHRKKTDIQTANETAPLQRVAEVTRILKPKAVKVMQSPHD